MSWKVILPLLKRYWPIAIAILIVIGVGISYYFVYGKGEKAGAAGVTNAVQTDAIKKQDAARISKEKTDEEVRNTPYDKRVDGLR